MSGHHNPPIGKVITDSNEARDAVHFAIAPVTLGEDLEPGTHVSITAAGTALAEKPYIGIIDPFLTRRAKRGQRVFLFLYPGTVTGMRHHWAHPSFPEAKGALAPVASDVAEAESWLRAFAASWGMDYKEMVHEATHGGCLIARDSDIHGWDEIGRSDQRLFWDHIETVTGGRFDETYRGEVGFSCSC